MEERIKELLTKINKENGTCQSVELAERFIELAEVYGDNFNLKQILNQILLYTTKESTAEYESEERLYPNNIRCCYNCKHREYSKCELNNARRYDDDVCDRFEKDN